MLTASLDRVLHSAARLIASLYMPLSRVICVTHYTGFPFGSASLQSCCAGVALFYRHCPSLLAGTLSTLVGRQALHSSSGGKFLVPRVNTSTMQRRAISVVAPSIWNSLPSQIRLLPKSYTPYSTSCLKLIFFTMVGLKAPLSSFLEGALYKFSK